MSPKRILIIGGGMGGLAAGCYAQMNGFESHIYEKHEIAGGLCTAWTRGGYTFDISIHMLSGSRFGSMARMWDELGVRQGRTIIDHPTGGTVEVGGESFTWPIDLDELQAVMVARSPADKEAIDELIAAAHAACTIDFSSDKPQQLWGPFDVAKFMVTNLTLIRLSRKWGKVSVQEFAQRFHDPLLRAVILLNSDSPAWSMPDWPMTNFVMMLGMRHTRNMGYAIGGSFNIAQTILKRYETLGGAFHNRSTVTEVIVEQDRAVGVRLADGSEVRGDHVIAASDGRTALWTLLGGRYLSEEITRNYREWKPVPPLVMVLLGVKRDLSAMPATLSFELPQPITVAGVERRRMDILQTTFDPTLAPAGKSCVQVWYATDWDYWAALVNDRDRYEAEKEQIARAVIEALEARWPGFRADVEVVDVPTPLTFRRYTGNEQGSPDGWCATRSNATSTMPVTLPGLSGFYLAGQWTMPFAGVPGSAMSGRTAVQLICHEEKQHFVASLPPAGWGPVDVKPKDKPETRRGTGRATAQPASPAAISSVAIDADKCQGCGDCEVSCPEVFVMGGDGRAHVREGADAAVFAAGVRAAAESCPDGAILVA